jgi:hypothetical protein
VTVGLDMHLEGRTFQFKNREKRNGYDVKGYILDLGYWRKHPNLHGFIVQKFAKGVDECQDIPLTAENIETIIMAVKEKHLPKTEGFFFGKSDGSEQERDIEILTKALAWLEGVPNLNPMSKPTKLGKSGLAMQSVDLKTVEMMDEDRTVIYRASW